ncbi:MAG: PDZ domain-containing protein [Prevotellaceae bacterium]|jgi:carboxyl-terminal processing protease|nr:PDZ domain-containing protein [Prevotellaceae bacterium]
MAIQFYKKKIMLPVMLTGMLVLGIILGLRLHETNLQRQYLTMQKWNKLNTILNYIDKEYVDNIPHKEIEEQSIALILKSLDPHSTYIPASEMQGTSEPLDGNFDGIGVLFNMLSDTVVVINTIPGGPSERVGVAPGDRIITVNNSTIAGCKISQDSVMKLLRGKSGTRVNVGLKRTGEKNLIPTTITRGKIPIKSVDVAYMSTPRTGYIKISKFSRNTYDEFKKAAQKLLSENMQNLIVDLRGNSGGYLDQAIEVANEFLKPESLIVYTEGKASKRKDFLSDRHGLLLSTPVAILIDETSASASEVLAGAIQDNDRGMIIGRRSFGKGLVQEPVFFNDGSGIRLTVARYYTPSGRCIQRPYKHSNSSEYYQEIQRRYEHGELDVADSIKQNDSLHYLTLGGRVVYGGGGITPDIFVPIDTSGINGYYLKIFRKNLIYKYALQFADANRRALNSIKTFADLSQFLRRKNLMSSFAIYASSNGVNGTEEELRVCRNLVRSQIKAQIGRNTLLDDDGFYPFLENIDNVLQAAIQTLEKQQQNEHIHANPVRGK